MLFQREDWTLFRTISGLSQKAGVAAKNLPKVIIKEIVDNALDASETCRFGRLDGNGFFVEDDGPGIPGDQSEIASLFSISRPLTSSKLLRLPTRGALGNGIRVVVGAVLATNGSLRVTTNGAVYELIPQETGGTEIEIAGDADGDQGTRIEVNLGDGLKLDAARSFEWAETALLLSGRDRMYKGRTSPHWYDDDAFYELALAAGERTVRELLSMFDGMARNRLADVAESFRARSAGSLTRDESIQLLSSLKDASEPVKPSRLKGLGRDIEGYTGYAKAIGKFTQQPGQGNLGATVPYLLEVWAVPSDDNELTVCVNRTPITAEVRITILEDKTCVGVFGCGLRYGATIGRRTFKFLINITTPYMPITSDGKSPDLSQFSNEIIDSMEKAARSAKRKSTGITNEQSASQKDIVLGSLDEAIEKASGGGKYRYSLRQLFYAVRPFVSEQLEKELSYEYFDKIITEYENDLGDDLPGVYRDNRGTLYHPHEGREIPLGTLSVEEYERPSWTFNKILYIEKEGFVPILREVKWPERHDCAILTSKGFASRAARDLLDLLGETDEEILFFCVHDADAAGTLIYQSLQKETRARAGRKVKIINLGLEVDEARAMGLESETFPRSKKERPVASYVSDEDRAWLQKHRYELNAMDTPLFLQWLDEKMIQHGQGKVIPPNQVLHSTLEQKTRGILRDRITDRVLREARIDDQVEQAFGPAAEKIKALDRKLKPRVQRRLKKDPFASWRGPIEFIAQEFVRE